MNADIHNILGIIANWDEGISLDGNRSDYEEFLASLIVDDVKFKAHFVRLSRLLTAHGLWFPQWTADNELIENAVSNGLVVLSDDEVVRFLSSPSQLRRFRDHLDSQSVDGKLDTYWSGHVGKYFEQYDKDASRIDNLSKACLIMIRMELELQPASMVVELSESMRFALATRLQKQIDKHRDLFESGQGIETEEWVSVDLAFHSEVFMSLGLEEILPSFAEIHVEVHKQLVESRKKNSKGRSELDFIEEHQQILNALHLGDIREVYDAYRYHISRVAQQLGSDVTDECDGAVVSRNRLIELNERRSIHGVLECLKKLTDGDSHWIFLRSHRTSAREFVFPDIFAPPIALAITRGAKFVFVVDDADLEVVTAVREQFSRLDDEVSNYFDQNVYQSSIQGKALILLCGDTSIVVPASHDAPLAWPFGLCVRTSEVLDITYWSRGSLSSFDDNDDDAFVNTAAQRLAMFVEQLPEPSSSFCREILYPSTDVSKRCKSLKQ